METLRPLSSLFFLCLLNCSIVSIFYCLHLCWRTFRMARIKLASRNLQSQPCLSYFFCFWKNEISQNSICVFIRNLIINLKKHTFCQFPVGIYSSNTVCKSNRTVTRVYQFRWINRPNKKQLWLMSSDCGMRLEWQAAKLVPQFD